MELAKTKQVTLSTSAIRKVLERHGYKWQLRCQKPQYSKEDREARLQFAEEILEYTPQELQKEVTMCMDGVVLTLPPSNATERENYIKVGHTHIWRKSSESAKPELFGGEAYPKQVPYARQCPMWGGIGKAGFGLRLV